MMCRTVCSACAAGVIRLSHLLDWYRPMTARWCIVLAGSTETLDILTSCLPKTLMMMSDAMTKPPPAARMQAPMSRIMGSFSTLRSSSLRKGTTQQAHNSCPCHVVITHAGLPGAVKAVWPITAEASPEQQLLRHAAEYLAWCPAAQVSSASAR